MFTKTVSSRDAACEPAGMHPSRRWVSSGSGMIASSHSCKTRKQRQSTLLTVYVTPEITAHVPRRASDERPNCALAGNGS